jgi:hypothetical protein
MLGLNEFEQAVLEKMLAGEHPVLATLREQSERGRVANRQHSGVGFFCEFELGSDAPALRGNFHIGDVCADLEGLAHGVGLVLFIRDGRLSDVSDEEATRTSPDCTSSQFWPIFDATGVVASGVNVGIVGASPAYTDDQKKLLMSAHAVYGVLYAISAVYGFYETSKCKELKDKFEHDGAQWKPALKEGQPTQPPVESAPTSDVVEPATPPAPAPDAPAPATNATDATDGSDPP